MGAENGAANWEGLLAVARQLAGTMFGGTVTGWKGTKRDLVVVAWTDFGHVVQEHPMVCAGAERGHPRPEHQRNLHVFHRAPSHTFAPLRVLTTHRATSLTPT